MRRLGVRGGAHHAARAAEHRVGLEHDLADGGAHAAEPARVLGLDDAVVLPARLAQDVRADVLPHTVRLPALAAELALDVGRRPL